MRADPRGPMLSSALENARTVGFQQIAAGDELGGDGPNAREIVVAVAIAFRHRPARIAGSLSFGGGRRERYIRSEQPVKR